MTERILEEFEHQLDEVVLVPSSGGVFEVDLDGTSIYSKKATGKHAELDDVLASLRKVLA